MIKYISNEAKELDEYESHVQTINATCECNPKEDSTVELDIIAFEEKMTIRENNNNDNLPDIMHKTIGEGHIAESLQDDGEHSRENQCTEVPISIEETNIPEVSLLSSNENETGNIDSLESEEYFEISKVPFNDDSLSQYKQSTQVIDCDQSNEGRTDLANPKICSINPDVAIDTNPESTMEVLGAFASEPKEPLGECQAQDHKYDECEISLSEMTLDKQHVNLSDILNNDQVNDVKGNVMDEIYADVINERYITAESEEFHSESQNSQTLRGPHDVENFLEMTTDGGSKYLR